MIGIHILPTLLLSSLAILGLSACNTVSIPKSDLLEFPELQVEADNIGDYPSINDAPDKITDLRSGAQWDRAANEMAALKGAFSDVPTAPPLSDEEIENEIQALASKVKAYKLDDPPETYFPNP